MELHLIGAKGNEGRERENEKPTSRLSESVCVCVRGALLIYHRV